MSRQQKRYLARKAAKINRFKPMLFSDDMKHLAYTQGWKPLVDILKHAVSSEDFLTDPRVPDVDKKIFGKTNTFDIWVPHEYVEDCPQNVTQYGQISERDETHMNTLQEVIDREGLNNPGTMWMDIAMLIAGHHRRWVCKTRLGTKGFVYSVSRKFSYLELLLSGVAGQAKIEELLVDDNMRPDRHPWDLFQSIESIYGKYIQAGTMTEDQWLARTNSNAGKAMDKLIRKHPMDPAVYRAWKKVIEGYWYTHRGKDKGALKKGDKVYIHPRPNLLDNMKLPTSDKYFSPAGRAAENQLNDQLLDEQAVAYINSEEAQEILGVNKNQVSQVIDHTLRGVVKQFNSISKGEPQIDDFGDKLPPPGEGLFDNNGAATACHRFVEQLFPIYMEKIHGVKQVKQKGKGNAHIDYKGMKEEILQLFAEFKCTIKGTGLTTKLPKLTHVFFVFLNGNKYDEMVAGWIHASRERWSQTMGKPQISKKEIYEHGNILIGNIVQEKNGKQEQLKMVYQKINPETPLVRKRESGKYW